MGFSKMIELLLILAGISIATLTGSGLFEKARLAEQESKNKQEEEQGILGDYENKISKYISNNREQENDKINYSTDEQDTGLKWIDGKKIYQITIQKPYTSNSDYVKFVDTSE